MIATIKKIFAAAVLGLLFLPAFVSAGTFDDHTKIRQLKGTPQTPVIGSCLAGEVFSGGTCVLIPNQPTCGWGQVLSGGSCVAFASQGAMCGFYQAGMTSSSEMPDSYWEANLSTCNGYNVQYGCPAGFTRTQLPSGAVTCFKS